MRLYSADAGAGMAPVRKIEKATLEKHKVHGEVDGTYTTFQCGGGKHYFQIDTYASPERKLKGKKVKKFNWMLARQGSRFRY